MNKKNNRKGFTIVELVIVIAVIGILATVLIPTFGNVIENANKAAALQEAKSIYTNYVMGCLEKGSDSYVEDCWVKTDDGYYVQFVDGNIVDDAEAKKAEDFAANAVPTDDILESTTWAACENAEADEDAELCDWCGVKHVAPAQP